MNFKEYYANGKTQAIKDHEFYNITHLKTLCRQHHIEGLQRSGQKMRNVNVYEVFGGMVKVV